MKAIKERLIQLWIFFIVLLPSSFVLAAEEAAKVVEKPWYSGFAPIAILLMVICIVIWRLPKIKEEFSGQLSHREVDGYLLRRTFNWLVLGGIYAFLYWGRYNLNGAVEAIGGKDMVKTFNLVFSVGAAVYGLSFLINGPLTDRLGGRFSILIGGIGAAVMNALMGGAAWAAS